jgi:phosphodiesterase/alkaline phosphatase D-like protein
MPGRVREAIWRSFEIGDLATLVMLETRLTARSPAITWDDCPIPYTAAVDDPAARAGIDAFLAETVGAEDREMLGREQEAEVEAALARSAAAGKPWRILGNQTIMAPVASPDYVAVAPRWLRLAMRFREREAYALMRRSPWSAPLNLDQWDGYPAARERLYAAAQRAGSPLVVLTGDTHTFMVNRLSSVDGTPVGVEIGTSSVSSPGPFDPLPDVGIDFGRLTEEANPHVLHHNTNDRGYVALRITPAQLQAELRRVDTVWSRSFHVEAYKRYAISRDPSGTLAIEETASTV